MYPAYSLPLKELAGRATIERREALRREHARAFLVSAPSRLGGNLRASFLAKSIQQRVKSTHFIIEMRGGDLIVSLLNGKFKATYYKPPGRPNLILRERTKTDDDEMLDEAFRTAVAKARELGWIV
jgi:hypothetical protein